VGIAIGIVTLGPSFPLGIAKEAATGPEITVLTYNVFAHGECTACVIETIRTAGADLVALQELTPPVAAAIVQELAGEYPYRVLAPDPGVIGMGTISRYPLRATGETLPGEWFIVPQVLALDFMGQEVTVLNAHPVASTISPGPVMERSIRDRDAQARAIATFVAEREGPLIAPGDYNTTERNTAYDILSGPLRDAWREAGRGPGHTFPSADEFPLSWLVRIDYIFHSSHWRAAEARVLPWDGASDHRPLLARLVLHEESGR
jgi:vancomycin resistance protein VanJ